MSSTSGSQSSVAPSSQTTSSQQQFRRPGWKLSKAKKTNLSTLPPKTSSTVPPSPMSRPTSHPQRTANVYTTEKPMIKRVGALKQTTLPDTLKLVHFLKLISSSFNLVSYLHVITIIFS